MQGVSARRSPTLTVLCTAFTGTCQGHEVRGGPYSDGRDRAEGEVFCHARVRWFSPQMSGARSMCDADHAWCRMSRKCRLRSDHLASHCQVPMSYSFRSAINCEIARWRLRLLAQQGRDIQPLGQGPFPAAAAQQLGHALRHTLPLDRQVQVGLTALLLQGKGEGVVDKIRECFGSSHDVRTKQAIGSTCQRHWQFASLPNPG